MRPETSMSPTLATTPLHAWHLRHSARLGPFAGYEMPILYSSIVQEHQATRSGLGLFDISHMGRFRVEGDAAAEWLDAQLTRSVLDMQPGQIRYSLVCRDDGGILDDVLVYDLETPSGQPYFLLVVNASNRAKLWAHFQARIAAGTAVVLRDVTDQTAMIAVQGPLARTATESLLPPRVTQLRYYRGLVCEQLGKPVIVSRTGYTGEDGLELIVRAEHAERIWENTLLAGRAYGAAPVGLAARDTLRLEAAMPLYGHELDESIDPWEAGLAFAVNLENRDFHGRQGLLQRAPEAQRQRVGLQLEGPRAARQGAQVLSVEGEPLGAVTSGSFAPTLQRSIAMAYLPASFNTPGQSLLVDIRGQQTSAKVVPLPFYRRPTSGTR
jgi:aminomethyltransferase